jgi:hypothetical protein
MTNNLAKAIDDSSVAFSVDNIAVLELDTRLDHVERIPFYILSEWFNRMYG